MLTAADEELITRECEQVLKLSADMTTLTTLTCVFDSDRVIELPIDDTLLQTPFGFIASHYSDVDAKQTYLIALSLGAFMLKLHRITEEFLASQSEDYVKRYAIVASFVNAECLQHIVANLHKIGDERVTSEFLKSSESLVEYITEMADNNVIDDACVVDYCKRAKLVVCDVFREKFL